MGGTLDLAISTWMRGWGNFTREKIQKLRLPGGPKQSKKNTVQWNSADDVDTLKHTPFPEMHTLVGATRTIVVIGDPVLAFMSLVRRRFIGAQVLKLRKGLKPSSF